MMLRYARADAFHHAFPPSSASAKKAAAAAVATRDRLSRISSTGRPGSSVASREAAPTIDNNPKTRKAPRSSRPAPNAGDIGSSRVAAETIGTLTEPVPARPVIVTSTLYDPVVMSHKRLSYVPGAPGTGWAASAGGAPLVPVSQYTGRTVTLLASPRKTWTTTSTWAGTTPGGRTTTPIWYGPAAPR